MRMKIAMGDDTVNMYICTCIGAYVYTGKSMKRMLVNKRKLDAPNNNSFYYL